MGCVLCEHCTAACCRYLALPLDSPRSTRDYDDMRWYLMHEGISIFVEEGDWYVQLQAKCKNLAADNRCGVYETRPAICREYEAKDCDYSGKPYGYDQLFTHPSQLEAYYEQRRGKKLGVLKERPAGARGKRSKRKKKTA